MKNIFSLKFTYCCQHIDCYNLLFIFIFPTLQWKDLLLFFIFLFLLILGFLNAKGRYTPCQRSNIIFLVHHETGIGALYI